jgi:hypothetical protein
MEAIIPGAKALADYPYSVILKLAKNTCRRSSDLQISQSVSGLVCLVQDNMPACLGTGGILKHTVVVRLHPLILSLKGKLQIRLMSSRGSQCASIWSYSISVSMAPCHGAETGSIPVGTAKIYQAERSKIIKVNAGFV